LRAVQNKIGDVQQKVVDDFNNDEISQDAGSQLNGELQNLSDALLGN